VSEATRIPTLAGRVRPAYLSQAIGDKSVTVPQLKRALLDKRVSTMETHARKCARQLAGIVRGRIDAGFHNTGLNSHNAFASENVPMYRGMLRQYGCEPMLIDYALSCAEQLLQARGIVK